MDAEAIKLLTQYGGGAILLFFMWKILQTLLPYVKKIKGENGADSNGSVTMPAMMMQKGLDIGETIVVDLTKVAAILEGFDRTLRSHDQKLDAIVVGQNGITTDLKISISKQDVAYQKLSSM